MHASEHPINRVRQLWYSDLGQVVIQLLATMSAGDFLLIYNWQSKICSELRIDAALRRTGVDQSGQLARLQIWRNGIRRDKCRIKSDAYVYSGTVGNEQLRIRVES